MKYLLVLCATVFLLFSCEAEKENTAGNPNTLSKDQIATDPSSSHGDASTDPLDDPRNKQFKKFLDELPDIALPYTYLTCRHGTEGTKIFGDHNPTPFYKGYTYAVGKFRLKNYNVAVVTLDGADCMIPVLTTFAPDGQEIAKEYITMGRCGSGPCFECLDYTNIGADMSIYFADTIVTTDCDDDFNPIPGTRVKKVLYQEGRITNDGKIDLSGDLEKILETEE